MDNNNPEVIRHQMEETRASLSDKLETLEQQVVETVHNAASTMSDTVESVKEAVQDSVASVRDSVSDTVESVKETFDLHRQVDRHPWTMFGGSVALGYLGGFLLGRGGPRPTHVYGAAPFPNRFSSAYRNGGAEESSYGHKPPAASTPDRSSGESSTSWMKELGDHFGPEITKLKGLALGTMLGVLRDMVAGSIPEHLEPKVKELVDSFTKKLGGEPIQGPVLAPRDEESCHHHENSGREEPLGSPTWQEQTSVGKFNRR